MWVQTQSQGVSPELVKQFLDWNAEAATRCEVLSPAGAAPANVRALFHSSTVQRACSGCLLEQVTQPTPSQTCQAVLPFSFPYYGRVFSTSITFLLSWLRPFRCITCGFTCDSTLLFLLVEFSQLVEVFKSVL